MAKEKTKTTSANTCPDCQDKATLQATVMAFANHERDHLSFLAENGFFKGEKPNFKERCAELGLFPSEAMRPNSILRAIRRKQKNVIVRDFITSCPTLPEAEGLPVLVAKEKHGEKLKEYKTQQWVTAGENGKVFQGPLDLVVGLDILERVFRRYLASKKPEKTAKSPHQIADEKIQQQQKDAANAELVANTKIEDIRASNARLLQKAKNQQRRLNSLLLIVETISDKVEQKKELLRLLQSPVE